jgi:hypothetical protein
LDYLQHHNALVFVDANSVNSGNRKPIKFLGQALSDNKHKIEYAVCEDSISISPELSHLLINRSSAITKKVFDHKKIDVDMNADALKEALTPFTFKCSTYKIIDPYIFELTDKNVDRRLEFLLKLCETILESDDLKSDELNIEVFGRSWKKKSSGGKENLDEISIRNSIKLVSRLKGFSDHLNIRFIGLNDTNASDKIHLRYFYTEKYLFGIEHSFETREGKMQKVWFDSTENLSTFQRRFREQSIDYVTEFSFYADELFYDA